MERRHSSPGKPAPLPADFLRLVTEVFTANYDSALKRMHPIKADPEFRAHGQIYPTEVVLCVSLAHKNQLAATTAYASVDFDPKASSPTLHDLLEACVDAIGAVFHQLLNEGGDARLRQVADDSLSALENAPFDWTALEIEKRKIFVKIDKANLELDEMADDWLRRHDPDHQSREEAERKAMEELFITGPKKPRDPSEMH